MKQFLLATTLILVPVAAFTGYQMVASPVVASDASLGDLTSFKTIITDVQGLVTKGDIAGAQARITDYETAWDHGQTAMRPLNPAYWGNIDDASDVALKSLREAKPAPDKVTAALVALQAVLADPSKPAG